MELTQKQKQIVLTRMAELSAMIRRDAPTMAAHGMQELAIALHGEGNEELLNEEPWFTPAQRTPPVPPTAEATVQNIVARLSHLEGEVANHDREIHRHLHRDLVTLRGNVRELTRALSDLSYRVYP